MGAFALSRIANSIPVIVIVSVLTFFGQQLVPGDPLEALIGSGELEALDPQALEEKRSALGLDQPAPLQYFSYVGRVVQGDFGRSFRTRQPVTEMIGQRLPVSLKLSAVTFLSNIVIGLALGVAAALKPGVPDFFATSWAVLGVATPNFWVAILLILVFAVWLGWLPTSGWVDPFDDPIDGAKHMALPVLSLGFFGSATIMRQTRSSLLEVMRQDYVVTARAKGLTERRVVLTHALKNSMLAVITIIGLSLATLVGGSVLIERVFAIPGVGRMAIDAAEAGDFPVIQAVVLISAVAIVIANLITDIAYAYLDPRIRYR